MILDDGSLDYIALLSLHAWYAHERHSSMKLSKSLETFTYENRQNRFRSLSDS